MRQRTVRAVGGVVMASGVAGYVLGVLTPYPGRAFSIPAVMVGLALLVAGMTGDGP